MKVSIAAATLLGAVGLGISVSPSQALPAPSLKILDVTGSNLVEVRMSRRQVRRQRRSGGNANMPSRPPGAKQYGQTTGGPRR